MDKLTVALAKGRILKQTLPLFAEAGLTLLDDPKTTRKLVLKTNNRHVEVIILRATDVPTYVRYGAADIGVVGKDSLMEHGGEGIYEYLDLKIARCRLMVAGKSGVFKSKHLATERMRIATKYIKVARDFYLKKGQQIELIKLYGSMELAPIVGLADAIVDLVDTGNTLKANGLVPIEHIADISSRLIVNKASMKVKHSSIQDFVDHLAKVVKNYDD